MDEKLDVPRDCKTFKSSASECGGKLLQSCKNSWHGPDLYAKAKGGSKRQELNSNVRRFHRHHSLTFWMTGFWDNLADHPNVDRVQVKMPGDGGRMTWNSSFILMSFALLHSDNEVIAAKGNHTIAVVKS